MLPVEGLHETAEGTPIFSYRIVRTFPHDDHAFTQGLVISDGVLYEGTGLRGQSTIRRVDLITGTVLQIHALPATYFGEGLTVFGDRLIQLTWTSRQGFIYHRDSFQEQGTFTYPHEGWGITHDGTRLIVSDGTATLRFWDPNTFAQLGSVVVRDGNTPITRLNELEFIDGVVYANVWKTDRIARIDPTSGQVLSWIDLTGLFPAEQRRTSSDVLNGIAYDAEAKRLYVTGKNWPLLFEIEAVNALRRPGPSEYDPF